MSWRKVVPFLALMVGISAGVQAAPVATIVEGDSVLVRDATRLAIAEGTRLAADDLIETTAQTRLLRIEFDDGLMLMVAPETRLWIEPKFRGERGAGARTARFYLISGSVKLTRPDATDVATPLATPTFDIVSAGRDLVVTIAGPKVGVFAESGEVRLTERSRGKNGATQAGATLRLKPGEYYSRSGADKSGVASRPDADFIQRLPRAFLDSLPPRAGLFTAKPIPPKPVGEFAYDADAKPWVDSEASMRPVFVARWKSLANQPAFRSGVAADMRDHPEWDRVLYPEKYLPKPKPKPPADVYPTGSAASTTPR